MSLRMSKAWSSYWTLGNVLCFCSGVGSLSAASGGLIAFVDLCATMNDYFKHVQGCISLSSLF